MTLTQRRRASYGILILAAALPLSPIALDGQEAGSGSETVSLSTLLKAAASGFVVGVAGMNSSIEGGLIGSDGATMASFTLAGVAMALGSATVQWQAPTRADQSDSLARRPALRLSIGAGYHAMSDARQAFGLDARSRGTPTPAGSEWRLDLAGPVSRRLDLGVAVGVMNLIGHEEVTREIREGGLFGPIHGDFVTSRFEAGTATIGIQARRYLGEPPDGWYVTALAGMGRGVFGSSLPGSPGGRGWGPLLEMAAGTALNRGRTWTLEAGGRLHRIGIDALAASSPAVRRLDFSGFHLRLGWRFGP